MTNQNKENTHICIAGAGGFIGGFICRYFKDKGFTKIRGVDKKPLPDWYQRVPGVECLCLDLSLEKNCRRADVPGIFIPLRPASTTPNSRKIPKSRL